jgi:RNA polymerase sigma-70 factor, ECF subfamily
MTMVGPAMRQEIDPALVARLHARSKASRWSVLADRFGDVLARAAAKRFPAGDPGAATLASFLEGLHLEDLALAIGCADGDEAAWETFVSRYRGELTRAAAAIAGPGHGHDLADSLFAELFGVDARGTRHRPLFDYFHGRSRLSTWLHALLSQRHIDAVRAARRTSSLDEIERPEDRLPVSAEPPDPDRARLVTALQHAFDAALGALDPNDRLRLACYHVDGLTLAEIAKMFGEHEATASRKLTRIRQALRHGIDRQLARAHGFAPAQVRQCYEYALEDGGVHLTGLKLVAGNSVEPEPPGPEPDPEPERSG